MTASLKAFETDKTVKAQWPCRIIDNIGEDSGKLSWKEEPPQGDILDLVVSKGPQYDEHWHSGACYSRTFLENVEPVPEQHYRNGADVFLIVLAPVYGRLVNVPEPLGTYRVHGKNNYRGRALDEDRVRDYLRRFETNSVVLKEHLLRQGTSFNTSDWKKKNFNFLWLKRFIEAKQKIKELIPEGAEYILINGDEWGPGQPVSGRKAIPFLERNGRYWGPPPDGAAAIRELHKIRSEGVQFLVFWWTCFWWLDHYPELRTFLKANASSVISTDAAQIYLLQETR